MVINFQDLEKVRKDHSDKTIVFAGGCFDLLHEGHLDYLAELKSYGDMLVIAVSSDRRVKERKGNERPILNQGIRVRMMDALKPIDYALIAPETVEDSLSPTVQIIQKLRPDIFISVDESWLDFRSEIKKYGTKLKIIKIEEVNSTTQIIKRIKALTNS